MADDNNPALENLRKSPDALVALVRAWVDDLLDRPVGELLDRAEIVSAVAAGVRGVVSEPSNIELLQEQIAIAVQELQGLDVKGRLPERTVDAMRGLATQPFALDEAVMAEILDHEAARILLREVLEQALFSFTKQLASLFPGGETAFRIADRARGLAASAVVGTSIEERANESVEEAVAPALDLAAGRLSDDAFSSKLAGWRGHILGVLLDQPLENLVGTVDAIDSESSAAQLAEMFQGIAEWDRLETVIEKSLESALERTRDQSLRDIAAGTTLEQEWRPVLEKQLFALAWPFMQSDAFETWLRGVSSPEAG